ncbi:MAG: kynureninase [Bacteroidota bacterium]
MHFENTLTFAQQMDANDKLAHFKTQFHLLSNNNKHVVYLCGNSLGLQPKSARAAVEQELNDWAKYGVEGHFDAKNPWFGYHHLLTENAAKVVGALPVEVVIMNNLTVNLHLMMVSFYKPTATRYKIIMEAAAFPSDLYAMETQVKHHNLNPDEAIIELKPREGEHTIRTEDIIATINANADSLALVMLGGVNYYTGQVFDMQAISKAAHAVGAYAGFDLAHAAGNLHLQLHDWGVDFAVWCTYKYLNSGPGGTSGVFVHEKHATADLNRFAGWWGHDEGERFQMKKGFKPIAGAQGWQLSNAQIFPMAIHKASLEMFVEAGMENLRAKSELLTAYLEFILNQFSENLTIITPKNKEERGCQLSIIVKENGKQLFDYLVSENIMPDWREPDVIRMSPVPMYNTFEDVFLVGQALSKYFSK